MGLLGMHRNSISMMSREGTVSRSTRASAGFPQLVTWGEPQLLTRALYTTPQFNTITMVYASQEKLHNGVDEEGLSWSDMRSDIKKVVRL